MCALLPCVGEFGTVFRGMWKEQPKKQVAVAVKTLKVSLVTLCFFTDSISSLDEVLIINQISMMLLFPMIWEDVG